MSLLSIGFSLFFLVSISCNNKESEVSEQNPPTEGTDDGGAVAIDEQVAVSRLTGLIKSSTYTELRLQIAAVPPWQPRASVQDDILSILSSLVDKPDGIAIETLPELPPAEEEKVWTFSELQNVVASTFGSAESANQIAIQIAFLDGAYRTASGGEVLGVAWGYRYIVMFKESIERYCRAAALPLNREEVCSDAEYSIFVHELGHILGLVDNGLAMQTPHRDPDSSHGAHDENQSCVMYWAYGSPSAIEQILTSGRKELDAACLADLAAFRSE